MSSIIQEIPGADPLSASKGHRTRSGRRFGTSMLNTPSKSAKKNKDGGAGAGASSTTKAKKSTAKKNGSASRFLSRASSAKKRSASQQQQLAASLPAADLSYDFASLSLSQSFSSGTHLRSTSVGASSSSESRDDYEDAVTMRRLPSAITADYSVKMNGTASIFRSNRTSSEIASTIPTIQRSNPIFDTDRHYTINFDSDDEESAEIEGVATTTELGTASRLDVDASGNYVVRPQIQKKEEKESSMESIFRMVDRVLDNADDALSWMCLQRANPVIYSDDDNDAVVHHNLQFKEETSHYQPEHMWPQREDIVGEEDGVVLEMSNHLTEDEVHGYTIPMPEVR